MKFRIFSISQHFPNSLPFKINFKNTLICTIRADSILSIVLQPFFGMIQVICRWKGSEISQLFLFYGFPNSLDLKVISKIN